MHQFLCGLHLIHDSCPTNGSVRLGRTGLIARANTDRWVAGQMHQSPLKQLRAVFWPDLQRQSVFSHIDQVSIVAGLARSSVLTGLCSLCHVYTAWLLRSRAWESGGH